MKQLEDSCILIVEMIANAILLIVQRVQLEALIEAIGESFIIQQRALSRQAVYKRCMLRILKLSRPCSILTGAILAMTRTLRPGHCLDWLSRSRLRSREGRKVNTADNDNHSGFAFDDCINGAHVVLDAVAESSDCLPPLKSAASLVRFIVDLSQVCQTR